MDKGQSEGNVADKTGEECFVEFQLRIPEPQGYNYGEFSQFFEPGSHLFSGARVEADAADSKSSSRAKDGKHQNQNGTTNEGDKQAIQIGGTDYAGGSSMVEFKKVSVKKRKRRRSKSRTKKAPQGKKPADLGRDSAKGDVATSAFRGIEIDTEVEVSSEAWGNNGHVHNGEEELNGTEEGRGRVSVNECLEGIGYDLSNTENSYVVLDSEEYGRLRGSPSMSDTQSEQAQEDLSLSIGEDVTYRLAERLRQFTCFSKPYRWLKCEFFYSNLDRALFLSTSDFEDCLNVHFPDLGTRNLRKTEWAKIRRVFGKPRRLSSEFLSTEREDLEIARSKIRQIQQRKLSPNVNLTKDLPDEVPLHLTIGTRVTARVHGYPNRACSGSGLHSGVVEGLHLASNSYRITFDRKDVGTQSVMDYDVLSDEPSGTVSTASISMKGPRISTASSFPSRPVEENSPSLNSDLPADFLLGGFPVRFLESIIRFRKLLLEKRKMVDNLRALNTEAESMYGKRYPKDYVEEYADCVVSLGVVNAEISKYLKSIDGECFKMCSSKEISLKLVNPERVLATSEHESKLLVCSFNKKDDDTARVKNKKTIELITKIASLMFQLKTLSSDSHVWHSCDVHSIKDSLRVMKINLEGKSLRCFQNRIEMPVNRIAAGIVHESKQGKRERFMFGDA